MTEASPYSMSISLNVLEHLGIGLYSNVPAVLSEAVANAWDADAPSVDIRLDVPGGRIVIADTGSGMTRADINERYLMVGYRRREEQGTRTDGGRDVMGRKGIGKLSLFSIARFVEVHTLKEGERNGFRMDREAIRALVSADPQATYHPDVIEPDDWPSKGTRIVLSELRKKLSWTAKPLRRRLARRFSVIGPRHQFSVSVDGQDVSPLDRAYFSNLEFIWYLGEEDDEVRDAATKLYEVRTLDAEITVDTPTGPRPYPIKGWIGTVDQPGSLESTDNAIVVLARGKLVHEDLMGEFQEAGVYADYVIGEIHADFLDSDDEEDIVTSARQSVKEDDPRFIALRDYVQEVLRDIKNQWTKLRYSRGVERARRNPVIEEWYSRLKGDTRKYAKRLFGKIESLRITDPHAKAELYKASLLAFEKLALNETLSVLDKLETPADFELVQSLFGNIDDLEAAHYHQIIKGRLQVLRSFVNLVPDAKEKVIHRYIYDHLWLIEASWERAATKARIEEAVKTEFEKIEAGLTDEERKGRVDIRYQTAARKHIIIELKKYDRVVEVTELVKQLTKYRDALDKCLETKFPGEPRHIEVISILGQPLRPQDHPERNARMLDVINARAVTYDELIQDALDAYEDYLERDRRISELVALVDRLESSLMEPEEEPAALSA